MKLADYAKVKELKEDNIFLLDGPEGTKTILVRDLVTALIELLNSEGFVSGIDMAELDPAETVLTDNIFLLGTDAGNKSIDAATLAKKLVGMLTSGDLANRLTISELDKTIALGDGDYVLAGTTAGTRAMTAKDLAKALIAKLTTAELTNGMKLSELVSTSSLTATDNVLVGTSAGNKAMTAGNLAKRLPALLSSEEFISSLKMGELGQKTDLTNTDNILIGTEAGNKYMKAEDALFAMIDAFGPPEMHRNVFGGRNLGTSVTEAQKAAIRDGSFKGLFVGDYWVIDGVNWRIADMDYFYNTGGNSFAKHHLVIVPDKNLYNAKMNDSNITDGGYVDSVMHKTNLAKAKNQITAAFPDLVLTHKEYFTNAVSDGHPSGSSLYDSTVELMSEIMVYGTSIFAPGNNGTNFSGLYTIGKQQLSLFALDPKMSNTNENYWLRDIVSATHFAALPGNGNAGYDGASYMRGVRPYFCIG